MEKKYANQLRLIIGFGLVVAPGLGVVWPESLEPQVATRLLPAILHSLTLGVFVPLFILRLYREPVGWPKLSRWVLGLLSFGLVGFLTGFLSGNRWFFYLGGHYAAPAALYLVSFQAARGAWVHRKEGGLHQFGWISLGLFVAVNLGGMLVLDRFYGGKYGFFSQNSVLTHGLGAVLLFLLPFILAQTKRKASGAVAFWVSLAGLAGFLFHWAFEQPAGLWGTALVVGGYLALIGVFLQPKKHKGVIKAGWLIAALGASGPLWSLFMSFDLARVTLGWVLFFLFGLAVPYLVERSSLWVPAPPAFSLVQLGFAALLAALYVANQSLRWVFALILFSWVYWLYQGRPKRQAA